MSLECFCYFHGYKQNLTFKVADIKKKLILINHGLCFTCISVLGITFFHSPHLTLLEMKMIKPRFHVAFFLFL